MENTDNNCSLRNWLCNRSGSQMRSRETVNLAGLYLIHSLALKRKGKVTNRGPSCHLGEDEG